jgi:16S rRNA (uracil1498-N3)-methyltransferase
MAEKMRRFFLPKGRIPEITGADVHHIRDVLRMQPGDGLELLDGTGKIYTARISDIGKEKIRCEALSVREEEIEPKVKVTLAQSLTKGHKMDLVIEKCTELGVFNIIPMATERTVAKTAKADRWRRIAKEAAEQSARAIIPDISPLMDFEEVLKLRKQYDQALIPWELEKNHTLKKHFTDIPISRHPDILIMIGPEGGFSQSEVEQAKRAGFISVSLGKRVLRTETAGMAVLAAIMYESEPHS